MKEVYYREEYPLEHIKLTELDDALQLILDNTTPIEKYEFVSLFDANGRVLAQDLICKKALPAFNNSAMDGYAVKLEDAGEKVTIQGSIFAGDEFKDLTITRGFCHKIMTGAIVPDSCEAIVPFEDVEVINESEILLPKKIKPQAHIRYKGEERDLDEEMLKTGTLLSAGEIALLASQGVSSVKVFKKISVAVISSGDEIIEPWNAAKDHQIYNSNSMGIYSFLQDLGVDPTYVGALPDDKNLIRAKVEELKDYDLIVSSGGVSVGEADYTAEVFRSAGLKMYLHGIACKPGKHGMFGRMDTTHVLGLPGNPLASMSMFLSVVSPVVCKLSGRRDFYPNFALATVANDFTFKGKRANIIYGTVSDGEFAPYKEYKYSSSMLTPLAQSNGFIISRKGVDEYKKGDGVKVILPHFFNLTAYKDLFS